jgi:hypothetical protein
MFRSSGLSVSLSVMVNYYVAILTYVKVEVDICRRGKLGLLMYMIPSSEIHSRIGAKVNGKLMTCLSALAQVLQPRKRRQREYKFCNSEHPGTKSVPEGLRIVRYYVCKEGIYP